MFLFSWTTRYIYICSIFIGLCAVVLAQAMSVFPYTPDSACYIEQARSLLTRGVLENAQYDVKNPLLSYAPSRLFPVAYPLLLAVLSKLFAVLPEQVALLLSKLALVMLPSSVVFAFHNVVGAKRALAIGALLALTPVVIRWGNVAAPDMPSLLLVIFCLGSTLRAGNSLRAWFLLGVLLGFAYTLRNANLALLLTVVGFLLWALIFAEQRREQLRLITVCLLGCLLVIAPSLLRNLNLFGSLQPYAMPPSNIGFWANSVYFLHAQLVVITANETLADVMTQTTLGLLGLLIIVAMLLWQLTLSWRHWHTIQQQAFLLAALYFFIGSAMTITARSTYQWGELISSRHAMQYVFALLLAGALLIKNCIAESRWLISVLLLARLMALPQLYAANAYDTATLAVVERVKNTMQTDPLCGQLNGRFGVSNYAVVYRILCGTPIRHVFPVLKNGEFANNVLSDLLNLPVPHSVVAVFANHDVDKKDLPLKQAMLTQLQAQGWRIERNEKSGFILSH